jgi:YggT family protein
MVYVWLFLINALRIYSIILFIRVVLTWIPSVDYNNPFVKFLYQVTEPILQPIRQRVPPYRGYDLSTLIVFVAIIVLTNIIQRFLYW